MTSRGTIKLNFVLKTNYQKLTFKEQQIPMFTQMLLYEYYFNNYIKSSYIREFGVEYLISPPPHHQHLKFFLAADLLERQCKNQALK
jgi:hypothetical protein